MRRPTTPALLIAIFGAISAVSAQTQRDGLTQLRMKAERGDTNAAARLGARYEHGMPSNITEAMRWYRKAAEQGNPFAQQLLGKLLYEGKRVPKDVAEAFKWMRSAAEQGHILAQVLLAVMYGKAEGTPRDGIRAYAWLSVASANETALRDLEGLLSAEEIAKARSMARGLLQKLDSTMSGDQKAAAVDLARELSKGLARK